MAKRRQSRKKTSDPARGGRPALASIVDQIEAWPPARLFTIVALSTFAIRVLANVVFAAQLGRFASINPEIWFYLNVAGGVHPDVYRLSPLDPTVWLLRPLGMVFGGDALYTAILVLGAATMAVAAGVLALAAQALTGAVVAGLAAGWLYTAMPWTYGASLSGFTHDTVGMAFVTLGLWAIILAKERRQRWWPLVLVAALLLGAQIGPSMLAVLVVALVALPLLVVRGSAIPRAVGTACALIAIFLAWAAVAGGDAEQSWVGWIWHRLAGAAASQRGLDIVLQRQQGSADLLPGHPWTLVREYPWTVTALALLGAVMSLWRGRIVPIVLIGVGVLGYCVAARGIRMVEVAWALAAGVAIGELGARARGGGGRWRPAALVTGLVLVLALVEARNGALALASGLALAMVVLASVATHRQLVRAGALLAASVLLWIAAHQRATQVLAVGNAHVEVLRAVREHRGNDGGSILPASWDLGYMVGAVSGLEPAAHPEAIHAAQRGEAGDNDARIFWSPEIAAAAEATRRGIRYLYIGERDFEIVEEDERADRFRLRRRRGFQMPTISAGGARGPLPLSIARELFIYHLLKDPKRLKSWRLLAEAQEATTGERVRVFELVDPPDPERSYVFAVLHNPHPRLIESNVQLALVDGEGTTVKQGARLQVRVRPYGSSMSIFSFIGFEHGVGRAAVSNPELEVRLVARQAQGHYTVDFVRPAAGWRPLDR